MPAPAQYWILLLTLIISPVFSQETKPAPASPPAAKPAAAQPAVPPKDEPKKEEGKESADAGQKPQDAATLGLPNQMKTGTLPPNNTSISELAAQAFGRKDWETARKYYEQMLRDDPLNALTHANLGAVEQQAGRLKEAQALFSRAVAINPDLQQTWVALGLVSYEKGDLYYALHAIGRAIHEDPTDARAHNYLAAVSKKLGWLDAAEAELLRAIELDPNYGNAHFNLCIMYLERKPPALELAKRHYEKAVALGAARDELVEEKLKD
ncbi:tetratricopeptide repeat protein [Roseimicrobium gellanilyticum]|uniref:Tetratricopeptide repeat protein n=1 Tax=Roseimicrobium gellanilyticum TaxID=748857 RepID=A0A366HK15_9BACT|nr:tetratricopeptide repeat protein [Roseimicrobium gellanilyticum]RBP42450.1 tetratricopeptide repeat protein [Roseimicrobium gellanilyticum]